MACAASTESRPSGKAGPAGVWKLPDVARICREDFGIDGIEYVTAFFEAPVESYLEKLNKAAADHGVANVLIMVDGEGDMVSRDRSVRMQAAVNHRKWVDVAGVLGCHAIRCNARGAGDTPQEDPDAIDRAAEAFGALIQGPQPLRMCESIGDHTTHDDIPGPQIKRLSADLQAIVR